MGGMDEANLSSKVFHLIAQLLGLFFQRLGVSDGKLSPGESLH